MRSRWMLLCHKGFRSCQIRFCSMVWCDNSYSMRRCLNTHIPTPSKSGISTIIGQFSLAFGVLVCFVFIHCPESPCRINLCTFLSQHPFFHIFHHIWQERWYVIVLGLLLLGLFMAGFIHLCAVHTPTSNPNVDAAYRAKRECDQLRALQKRKAKLIVSRYQLAGGFYLQILIKTTSQSVITQLEYCCCVWLLFLILYIKLLFKMSRSFQHFAAIKPTLKYKNIALNFEPLTP